MSLIVTLGTNNTAPSTPKLANPTNSTSSSPDVANITGKLILHITMFMLLQLSFNGSKN